jgi:glucose uptake protein GlcU
VVVPVYQCCIIIGTLCGGCFVMGEFQYYSDKELRIIAIGNIIAIVGIIFKVCMLESKDLEAEV